MKSNSYDAMLLNQQQDHRREVTEYDLQLLGKEARRYYKPRKEKIETELTIEEALQSWAQNMDWGHI